MRSLRLSAALVLLLACANTAHAQEPIQLALFSPIQIVPPETSIHGFRLSLLYGDNQDMLGFDLGLVTRTRGELVGIQFGVVGLVEGDLLGWQNNLIVNVTARKMRGVQVAAVNLHDSMVGAALGLVNYTDSEAKGFDLGVFNYATEFHGFMLGIVNYAKRLHGLQIGIVNIAVNAAIPVLPIVNWVFD